MDLEERLSLGDFGLFDRAQRTGAGVVDEDIDASDATEDRRNCSLDRRLLADVEHDCSTVQRLSTVGELMPATGSDADYLGSIAQVPYSAQYVFTRRRNVVRQSHTMRRLTAPRIYIHRAGRASLTA
jgi:hypothetical protein